MNQDLLNLIKDSFEIWYNRNVSKDNPITIVINYNDLQTLSIKAFHTVNMEVSAVGIKDNLSYVIPLISIKENYNHGITTEQEAKEHLTGRLLQELYGFSK